MACMIQTALQALQALRALICACGCGEVAGRLWASRISLLPAMHCDLHLEACSAPNGSRTRKHPTVNFTRSPPTSLFILQISPTPISFPRSKRANVFGTRFARLAASTALAPPSVLSGSFDRDTCCRQPNRGYDAVISPYFARDRGISPICASIDPQHLVPYNLNSIEALRCLYDESYVRVSLDIRNAQPHPRLTNQRSALKPFDFTFEHPPQNRKLISGLLPETRNGPAMGIV